MFHGVVARGRFSLPAPSAPRNRHWAPCHAVVAMPLLIAFELLLCIYLESLYVRGFPAVDLKIVFLPLLTFEVIILIDNFRMCKALMPGDEERMSDEAIWETLPHFWVAISMVFFVAATVFTLLKLSGSVASLGWWDLFINFTIAECFAFLVCTKWSNPVIHRSSREPSSSSSTTIRYLDWNNGLLVSSEEDQRQARICTLQDIGGHFMKVPIIVFQGTPAFAAQLPLAVLFSPLFVLQGVGVILSASKFVEKLVLLLRSGAGGGLYFRVSSIAHDCLGFLHHGSRLLGWWSIDEGSREEQARLYHEGASGYNTFSGYPPEIVKKMPKRDLAEEVDMNIHSSIVEITCIGVETPGSSWRADRNYKIQRKCCAEFVLRGRLASFYSHVGIVSFAAYAQRSVRCAQFAATISQSACPYMTSKH
ncbi:transmembrane fragile-X-F-associated protein [Trifolium pratense]|uniref:Transmembrane fragile-X-F-associated protein n=1 Tax=Trifolium pratense TaxID=57577 RepID=A0A2K3P808_TRIPR|nr:transmembrane fragile-X-F-associated protein [Trifolium pratense]